MERTPGKAERVEAISDALILELDMQWQGNQGVSLQMQTCDYEPCSDLIPKVMPVHVAEIDTWSLRQRNEVWLDVMLTTPLWTTG